MISIPPSLFSNYPVPVYMVLSLVSTAVRLLPNWGASASLHFIDSQLEIKWIRGPESRYPRRNLKEEVRSII